MSKEAKMLFISLGLMVVGIFLLFVNHNYNCHQLEYQTLEGTRYKMVCEEKPDPNCWNNYKTEDEAIQACEGNQ